MMKLFILLLLAVASPALATTRYVSPAGSGSTCSDGSPCSLSTGLAATAAGDTLILKNGTYTSGMGTNTIASGLNASSPTIIQGETYGSVIIQPAGGGAGVQFSAARNYITIKNIIFDVGLFNVAGGGSRGINFAGTAIYNGMIIENVETKNTNNCGVYLGDGFTNGIIRNAYIRDAKNPATANTQCGIYIRGSNNILEHSRVENVGSSGLTIYSTTSTGTGNIIRYNTLTTSGGNDEDADSRAINCSKDNTTIHNNIIYGNPDNGIKLTSGCSNSKIYNNTVYGNGQNGIEIDAGISTGTIANNIVAANTAGQIVGTGPTLTTNSTSAACMIDPANQNFSLVESSACIDAGTVITGFSEGRYVGAGVDQGALEAPIRSSAVVEDATDTIYRITLSLPTQSTRDGTGLQTCTVGNIAVTVAGAGATESSCSTSGSASRVDTTLGAAVTVGQALTDAYTRSTAPTLTDNVCIGDPNTTCYNAHVRTYSAAAGTNNVDGGALPAFTQTRYRFHKLRGTEASPSLLNAGATENVSVTLPPGAAFRLRVKFRTDDNPDATTFKLRYSKDAGAYTDIPDTISTDNIGWYGVTSDTDIPAVGSATTELLTSDEATNVACAVVRTSSDYPLLDFNNGESECEYVLKISTSAAVGTTYDFRVYKGDNTALDTYSVTPRLTVGSYTSFGF